MSDRTKASHGLTINDDGVVIIDGKRFFDSTHAFENKCEKLTDKLIASMGKKAPKTLKTLGSVLGYGDAIASCFWGCPYGGAKPEEHTIQYLCGRATSFGRGAVRLAQMAFYDEALTLV